MKCRRGARPQRPLPQFRPCTVDFQGWCIREFYTRAGQKLEHIRSPGGNFFPGRSVNFFPASRKQLMAVNVFFFYNRSKKFRSFMLPRPLDLRPPCSASSYSHFMFLAATFKVFLSHFGQVVVICFDELKNFLEVWFFSKIISLSPLTLSLAYYSRRAAMEWMREQGASPEDLVIMQVSLKNI